MIGFFIKSYEKGRNLTIYIQIKNEINRKCYEYAKRQIV